MIAPLHLPPREDTAGTTGSRYTVLGGVLHSVLAFPHLPPAPEEMRPSWTVSVLEAPAPKRQTMLLGSREMGPERYDLYQDDAGWRLVYSHAGTFDLSSDGTRINWYRESGANEELAQAIILGPVLSLALQAAGDLCLHGSAVAIEGRAIGFLGGKYYGKSTMATALTSAGARLISDDVLAVHPQSGVLRPGVPSVRLWADSAEALCIKDLCRRVEPGVKTTASGFMNAAPVEDLHPIEALYLLEPVTDPEPEMAACWREPVRGPGAAVSLAHQSKLPASLVGPRGAGLQLQRAVRTVTGIPIWRLYVVRDLERIEEVVAQIVAWHTAKSRTAAVATVAGNE